MQGKELILGIPLAYETFQAFVGKFGKSRRYLYSKYLPYTPGVKTLDLGCGPGTSTAFFRQEDYIGIDISPDYLAFAQDRFPNHEFINDDFLNWHNCNLRTFRPHEVELIFAMGLFHHLPDDMCKTFFSHAFRILPDNGRMVTMDGCTHKEQWPLAKFVVQQDRGRYVRDAEHLRKLAESTGFQAVATIEENAYNIPYTTAILSLVKKGNS